MKIYVGIDDGICINIAVDFSKETVLEKLLAQDEYFKNKEDFFENHEEKYTIEEWG